MPKNGERSTSSRAFFLADPPDCDRTKKSKSEDQRMEKITYTFADGKTAEFEDTYCLLAAVLPLEKESRAQSSAAF